MVAWGSVYGEMASQVGWREGPNNANPWGPEQGISNAAYCNSFACMVPYHQGYRWHWSCTYAEKGCAYVPYHQNGAAGFGRVRFDHASKGDPADLVPGDQVTFDWNNNGVPDHIETVVQVYADGTFDTIGANTGSPNGVWRIRRDRRYLLARIRLDYDGVPAPRPAPAPAPQPAPAPAPAPSQAPPWPGRVLRLASPMMNGGDVRQWQDKMRNRGWNITVDGWYGNQSATICRQFQADKHLTVDGEVGPQTWSTTWNSPVT